MNPNENNCTVLYVVYFFHVYIDALSILHDIDPRINHNLHNKLAIHMHADL